MWETERALVITWHNPSNLQALVPKKLNGPGLPGSWWQSWDRPTPLISWDSSYMSFCYITFANLLWKVFLFLILATRGSHKEVNKKLIFFQRAQKMKRNNQMILTTEIVHLCSEDRFTLIIFLDYMYLVDEGKGLRLTNNLNSNKNKQKEQKNTFRWSKKLNLWIPQKGSSAIEFPKRAVILSTLNIISQDPVAAFLLPSPVWSSSFSFLF